SPQTRSSCIGYSLERCPRRTRGPRPTMIAPVEESATGAARTSQKAAAEHVPFRSKLTLSQVGTLKDPIRIPGSRIVCPTRKGAKPRCTCQNLKRSVRYEANCVHDFDDRRHDRPWGSIGRGEKPKRQGPQRRRMLGSHALRILSFHWGRSSPL